MKINFEHKTDAILTRHAFFGRLFKCFSWTLLIVFLSIAFGWVGYMFAGGISSVDALYRSCLILADKEILDFDIPPSAKYFESFFVLYARLVFFSIVTLLIAPIAHRILHTLHLQDEDLESRKPGP